jgi:hypothetical protein
MLDKTATPPESPNWKNFLQVRRCYIRDLHGDLDQDFAAYCCALSDGFMPEQILDATIAMTGSACGKDGQYSWIPKLAVFLMNLPPPVSNVVKLR